MLARAPGDVAHADLAQVKRSPPAAGFTPSGLGQRGSVPSYAGSERAAAGERGPAKVDDGERTMDGLPEQ